MKLCPHCNAQLEDHARFCLCCMTSLDEKEQIPPPEAPKRRWPLLLLAVLALSACAVLVGIFPAAQPPEASPEQPPSTAAPAEKSLRSCTVDGVCYTFRPATRADHPTAIRLEQHYVLVKVEGTPADGLYRVPSFVGEDTDALVSVVADGAFAGTDARKIDLGHNVRYVWENAFGGNALTDLYLHEDVQIDRDAFSGCSQELTVHCPEYLENKDGALWRDLAAQYGFRWQQEDI